MGKSGVGPDFASPPYKRCAHFAHFAETLCRVVRDPLAGGHAPWGLRPLPPTARGGATGDDLPCGGRPTLHPPGHTPGHCSFLHAPSGVLITGDALFNVRGLRYSLKTPCTDVRLSRTSAAMLGELDFSVAGFTHGTHVATGA